MRHILSARPAPDTAAFPAAEDDTPWISFARAAAGIEPDQGCAPGTAASTLREAWADRDTWDRAPQIDIGAGGLFAPGGLHPGAALQVPGPGQDAALLASSFVGITDSYTSGNPDGSGFNVQVDFRGDWDPELKQAFIDAADLLSEIITEDIPDANLLGPGIFRPDSVDDVQITAVLTDIDGPSGTLGQAGPRSFRLLDGFLPKTGRMEFDIADAEDYADAGLFDDLVFHEMMHVLGFGTLWTVLGLTRERVRQLRDRALQKMRLQWGDLLLELSRN